jgi:hypothetical protein
MLLIFLIPITIILILGLFFHFFSKIILIFLFSQSDITFSQLESFFKKLNPHPILTRILSKIYYHTRLYAQKTIFQTKSISVPLPDWSRLQLPENTKIIKKKIIFLRHSTSNFNKNKQQDQKRTKCARFFSKCKRILQEILILPTNSTLLLDPPLCKRGIYQSFKMQQFLSSFSTPKNRAKYGPNLQNQVDILHKCAGLDFGKLLKRLPVSLKRYRNEIQKTSQFDVIDILNGDKPGTAITNMNSCCNGHGQDFGQSGEGNNKHSDKEHDNYQNGYNNQFDSVHNPHHNPHHNPQSTPPPNTLLVSSSHRRAMTTLALVCKGFLNQHPDKKINIHSSLASFSPTSPNEIPHLEGFDTNYISEVIKRGEDYEGDEIFDSNWNKGAGAINDPAINSILDFANWLSTRSEDNIIVCGHSSWLLWFFRTFLSRKVTHVGKVQKLKNTCCISFELSCADITASLYEDVVDRNRKGWESRQDGEGGDVDQKNDINKNDTSKNDKNKSKHKNETKNIQWVEPDSIEIIYRGFDMDRFYQYQAQAHVLSPKVKNQDENRDQNVCKEKEQILDEKIDVLSKINSHTHHPVNIPVEDSSHINPDSFGCSIPLEFANNSAKKNDKKCVKFSEQSEKLEDIIENPKFGDIYEEKDDKTTPNNNSSRTHLYFHQDEDHHTITNYTLSHISSMCSFDISFNSNDHHEEGFQFDQKNDDNQNDKDDNQNDKNDKNECNNKNEQTNRSKSMTNLHQSENSQLSNRIGSFRREASHDAEFREHDVVKLSTAPKPHSSPPPPPTSPHKNSHNLDGFNDDNGVTLIFGSNQLDDGVYQASFHGIQSIVTQSSVLSSSLSSGDSNSTNGDFDGVHVGKLDDIDEQYSFNIPKSNPNEENKKHKKSPKNTKQNLANISFSNSTSPPHHSPNIPSQTLPLNNTPSDPKTFRVNLEHDHHQQESDVYLQDEIKDDPDNVDNYNIIDSPLNEVSIRSDGGDFNPDKSTILGKPKHIRNKSFSLCAISRETIHRSQD